MTAALTFQLVNLIVSVALFPILLAMLGVGDYLLWVLFVTIGGLTLQLESAIQTLMARRLAPAYSTSDRAGFATEDRACRKAFAVLAAAMLLLVLPLGYLYFRGIAPTGGRAGFSAFGDDAWAIAWLLFCGAYALNYAFGHNNVRLIATGRASRFFWCASAGRMAGLVLTILSLQTGLGLLGLSGAFMASVVLTVSLIAVSARGLQPDGAGHASPSPATSAGRSTLDDAGLIRYTGFTLVAYLLYRGSFLVVAKLFPAEEAAAYGLALQAFAILFAVALIPATVRLSHLVRTVVEVDAKAEDAELARWLIFAACAMFAGVFGLLLVADPLLSLIGSDIDLPPTPTLLLLGMAFLVESWIFVFINPLLIRQQLAFIGPYVATVMVALLLAGIAGMGGWPLALAMLTVPLILQLAIALPSVFGALARAHHVSRAGLAGRLVAAARGLKP